MKHFYALLLFLFFSLSSFSQFLDEITFHSGISTSAEKVLFDTTTQTFWVAALSQVSSNSDYRGLIVYEVDTNGHQLNFNPLWVGGDIIREFGKYSDTSFYLVVGATDICEDIYPFSIMYEYIPSTGASNRIESLFNPDGLNGFSNGERLKIVFGSQQEQILKQGDSIIWTQSYPSVRGLIREGLNQSIAVANKYHGNLSILDRITGQLLLQKSHDIDDFFAHDNTYYIANYTGKTVNVYELDSTLNPIQSSSLTFNYSLSDLTIKKAPNGIALISNKEIVYLDNNLNITFSNNAYNFVSYYDFAFGGGKEYIAGENGYYIKYGVLLETNDTLKEFENLDITLDSVTVDTFIKGNTPINIDFSSYIDATLFGVHFAVTNNSSVPINEFYIQEKYSGFGPHMCAYSGYLYHVDSINIPPSASTIITIPSIYLRLVFKNIDQHTISSPCFKITAPNKKMDKNPSNNWFCANPNANLIIPPANTTTDTSSSIDTLDFKLYPNPAITTLNIEIEDNKALTTDADIAIYNTMGQLVHHEILGATFNKVEININKLQCGMYYVQIQDSNGLFITHKFIKEVNSK